MIWRHSSVPSIPESLITVKSPKTISQSQPATQPELVTPAATTFPEPSKVIALAESKRSGSVPLMTRRQISAPVAPLYLITVKAEPAPLFVVPAAITLPAESTTTALAQPEWILACQAQAPEHERSRLYAPTNAMTNVFLVLIVRPLLSPPPAADQVLRVQIVCYES